MASVEKHTGFHFAGMKWFKIAILGIAKYVSNAGIGANGIVIVVTNVRMVFLCHVSTAVEKGFFTI
ncbi:MAG: hypothetical protein HYY20_05095 [Candidatus Tectomicrobia bacterium]|uniref:Uncharacterized protein n=1 Tax=Tectimicrobiota bacterium TaxID=2528274 RepID=A0A932FY94_UNCTE|nr:hypothetical protein [Candidatus Tectomicrobia bacterium]